MNSRTVPVPPGKVTLITPILLGRQTNEDPETLSTSSSLSTTSDPGSPSSSTSGTRLTSALATYFPPPNSKPESLSTAAKAGIAVGISFGVLVVLAVVFLVWRRRKRNALRQRNVDAQRILQQFREERAAEKCIVEEAKKGTSSAATVVEDMSGRDLAELHPGLSSCELDSDPEQLKEVKVTRPQLCFDLHESAQCEKLPSQLKFRRPFG